MGVEHLDGHVISADEARKPTATVIYSVWKWSAGRWRHDSVESEGASAAYRAEQLTAKGWEHVRIVSMVLR